MILLMDVVACCSFWQAHSIGSVLFLCLPNLKQWHDGRTDADLEHLKKRFDFFRAVFCWPLLSEMYAKISWPVASVKTDAPKRCSAMRIFSARKREVTASP